MKKRIFKLILIFGISVGIVLNSFGAVSVSDGSAFVTVAEFNSDLNNLSNRMAQLENSIDAKIDSMVSSYLTRNGIWNGVYQELSDSVKNKKEKSFLPAFKSGNIGTLAQSKERFKDAIVLKTNKSGMVFGSFSYGNHHDGVANHWYYGVYNNNSDTRGWVWDSNMVVTLSFYETEENVTLNFDTQGNPTNGITKSVVEIGKGLGFNNWYSNARLLIAIPLPEWRTIPFMFFTEKDKTLWWRWLDELSTFDCYAVVNHEAIGSTMNVCLNELSIY